MSAGKSRGTSNRYYSRCFSAMGVLGALFKEAKPERAAS